MGAGEGPRDWGPNEDYAYWAARPGAARRRRMLAGIGIGVVAALVLVGAGFVAGTVHPGKSAAAPAHNSGAVTSAPSSQVKVRYVSASEERSALLQSAARIATSLIFLANTHQALPTSFSNTSQGVLIGEPSGVVLGPLPYGNTVEWGTDSHGQVTVLTLVGSTFQTRVPLDVGAIPLTPETNT